MNALDGWRQEILGLLPAGFLRRDTGEDFLFVSDYPRRNDAAEETTEKLKSAGFTVFEEKGLAHLDGTPEKYFSLISGFPAPKAVTPTEDNVRLYALALRLTRVGISGEGQPLPLIRLTLKCLDAGDEDGLLLRLPPLLAVAQRTHRPLPAFAGCLIFHYLSDKEASPC